jgi:glycosyltransferase involved in cell wall biosynthesis
MHLVSATDLPPPPSGKSGWPWTAEMIQTPDRPGAGQWPKISIITPSYNQANFVEQTIRSVLLQQYPNLEYRIIDGGSTDGSVEIIKKYDRWIHRWSSAPDRGQVDALNRGMSDATGEILTWINSDDFLLPGALFSVAELYRLSQRADIISGARLQRSGHTGIEMAWIPWLDQWPLIALGFAIFPQEATFFSRRIWEAIGSFDETFPYCFDGIFFSKATWLANKILLTTAPLAGMHAHRAQKTLTKDPVRLSCEKRYDDFRWLNIPLIYKPLVRLCFTRFHFVGDPLLRLAVYRLAKQKFQIADYDWTNDKWFLKAL